MKVMFSECLAVLIEYVRKVCVRSGKKSKHEIQRFYFRLSCYNSVCFKDVYY